MIMKPLFDYIHQLIELRQSGQAQITLLAVCPNSEAVLQAAVKAARKFNTPMLLAATLNQVDRDGGYTGWTPRTFTDKVKEFSKLYSWDGPIYPCLDHGGPWLKDLHTLNKLNLEETLAELKASISSFLKAGYQLLHIDPTVDRTLKAGETLPVDVVVQRTVELILHSEDELKRMHLPRISYEVGSEEVHGGLVDLFHFKAYLTGLRRALDEAGLVEIWPCFVVAQVGTNLHTTTFDPVAARRLFEIVAPTGALIKGHYSDFVENPQAYAETGMGGANVGPEFTAVEYLALKELEKREIDLGYPGRGITPSQFMRTLENAVVESNRWKKWLQPGEQALDFSQLVPERRDWLVQTGARYVWTDPRVLFSRQVLYQNLKDILPDANGFVVDRIVDSIEKYIVAFNLVNALSILD
jgi:D-tagatose-1,6-bisphosphate aldolase subunit GatZ/KbaZ